MEEVCDGQADSGDLGECICIGDGQHVEVTGGAVGKDGLNIAGV